MVNFTVDELRRAMGAQQCVRNVSVIAHVDHGKTTLTDSLLSRAGLISAEQAGSKRATDTRKDEQEKGITIKSTAVTLLYDVNSIAHCEAETSMDGNDQVLVNLIDSPGHVDFSSEVTAALRVTDGAVVVVDAISGVCIQTETVLRQALVERIKPVLVINKLDRSILEKQLDPEELYQSLCNIINHVNAIIQTYCDESSPMGDLSVDPVKGNVAFAAGLQGWGFTLPQMAAIYNERTKSVDKAKLSERLWGNHFYNIDTKKWSNGASHAPVGSERGFCKFILDPIYKLLKACRAEDRVLAVELASKCGVVVSAQDVDGWTSVKELTRGLMRRWLPAADALLYMVVHHLPSPVTAQAYRTDILYTGPLHDPAAIGMRKCDPNGPVMMYISKMVPAAEKGRFFAFGRVFSGTIVSGDNVYVLGPDYLPRDQDGKANKDVHQVRLSRAQVLMAGQVQAAGEVPCGNVCALSGLDKFLVKTGTVTSLRTAHSMKVMKFTVSPVVRVAVEVEQSAHLPKLINALKTLAKSDPMVQVSSENGEHVVAGAGELHLEICMKDLEEYAGVPLKKSQPLVAYKETVTKASSQVCLAKSGNKHNRFYMKAEPLNDQLISQIADGEIYPTQDGKERARRLVEQYAWDAGEARRLWCFGPDGRGPNVLVNVTKCAQHLNEVQDTVMAGFQWATQEGVLCEEAMRGLRVDLVDLQVHADAAHRRGPQVIPAARRAVLAAALTADPRLLEPVFRVQVTCPQTAVGGIYAVLNKRRGAVIEEQQIVGSPLFDVKAFLPVNESFGFTEELRGATSGQAFPQCVFDHWQVCPGDPTDPTSRAGAIVRDVRVRKGLNPDIPPLTNFLDKL